MSTLRLEFKDVDNFFENSATSGSQPWTRDQGLENQNIWIERQEKRNHEGGGSWRGHHRREKQQLI